VLSTGRFLDRKEKGEADRATTLKSLVASPSKFTSLAPFGTLMLRSLRHKLRSEEFLDRGSHVATGR
jgi:hypothetical protein